jgi:hypothetical protein
MLVPALLLPLHHVNLDTDAVLHLRRSSLYDAEPNHNQVCGSKAQTLDQ